MFFSQLKWILLLVSIGLVATSCKLGELPYTHTPSEPYVKKWNGETIRGTKVERINMPFQKDVIKVGNTTINSTDVAFYSTGSDNYANVGNRAFAVQVAAGKVNLYTYLDRSFTPKVRRKKLGGVRSPTGLHKSYFIQKKKDEPLEYLNYENMVKMVTPGTPEAAMLERYRKSRVVTRIFDYTIATAGYTGLGLVAAGAVNYINFDLIGPGLLLALMSGVAFDCIDIPLHFYSERKLFKAVLLANKERDVGALSVHVEADRK